MEELNIIYNNADEAYIVKKDKSARWPNDDCSNETLLKYLDRTDKIKRVQFTDEYGIGDGIKIYFE